MVNEWLYTVFTANKPIMLIDDLIGVFDDYNGIDPSIFCRELLELDGMGFDGIDIWINSDGGRVDACMQIFHTILKTKTKVYTYNIGRALSAAFVISLAGYKRFWNDYAVGMTHDVQDVENYSLLEILNGAVGTMIAQRSGKSLEEIQALMKVTTWMDAEIALNSGFCDEIVKSGSMHKTREKNPAIAYNLGLNQVQSIKTIAMSKVAVILGLNVASSEDVVASAVGALKSDFEKATNRVKELENQTADKDGQIDKLTREFEEAKAKILASEDEALTFKATNAATDLVNAGKITEESKGAWVGFFKKDFEGTKALGETLGINKAAPDAAKNQAQTSELPKATTLSGMLQDRIKEVQNKKI